MNIDWINEAKCAVDYSDEAVAEYRAGLGDGIRKYTERLSGSLL